MNSKNCKIVYKVVQVLNGNMYSANISSANLAKIWNLDVEKQVLRYRLRCITNPNKEGSPYLYVCESIEQAREWARLFKNSGMIDKVRILRGYGCDVRECGVRESEKLTKPWDLDGSLCDWFLPIGIVK